MRLADKITSDPEKGPTHADIVNHLIDEANSVVLDLTAAYNKANNEYLRTAFVSTEETQRKHDVMIEARFALYVAIVRTQILVDSAKK